MDNGDFKAPTWEPPTFKVRGESQQGSELSSGISTPPASEPASDDVASHANKTYSALMAELNKEIDCTERLDSAELQKILSSKLKPLLERVFTEASKVLHLSERLRPAVLGVDGTGHSEDQLDAKAKLHVPSLRDLLLTLGFGKNMDDLQSYLISADRSCLLSELEALQDAVQSLGRNLRVSEDAVQSLGRNLRVSDDSIQSLDRNLRASEDAVQSLGRNLQASVELSRSLRERLAGSGEEALCLQEALERSAARADAAEARQLRAAEESKAEGERKVRRIGRALKACEEQLQGAAAELRTSADGAREREEDLKEALQKAELEHSREAEQLQQAVSKAKEQKEASERELRSQIIGLKNQLLEERASVNKELEKSVKYEKELEETIRNLRQEVWEQKEGRVSALDCLRLRHQDVAKVQHLLEADVRHCSQTQEEWEKKTMRLVDSLDRYMLKGKQSGRESSRTGGPAQWPSGERGHSSPPQSLAVPYYCPLARPHSAAMAYNRQDVSQDFTPSGTNKDTSLSAQKRMRNLQSVHFQNSMKELLRKS